MEKVMENFALASSSDFSPELDSDIVSNLIDPEIVSNFVNEIIDARYPDLSGHQLRIKKNATMFAKQIGLSRKETDYLSIGAGIHDIGKLSISDYVLNKPAQLTNCEMELIKQHTQMSCKLLDSLKLDSSITEIVLYHHENYDGTGYPEKLSGDNIPLLARAVRILDSYDALTMNRPYHKGVSAVEALQILQRDAKRYDPHLLKLFCEIKL